MSLRHVLCTALLVVCSSAGCSPLGAFADAAAGDEAAGSTTSTFATPGCPVGAIFRAGDETCAGCDGAGPICGVPSTALCEQRENALGTACQLCVTDDGETLYDDCYAQRTAPADARCESVPVDDAVSTGAEQQSCETCFDARGNPVSTVCHPAHDACETLDVDGQPCERCYRDDPVLGLVEVYTECAREDIDPSRCVAYGNDNGRCVDCVDDDGTLLSHACAPAFGAAVVRCEENTMPDGLVCTVCFDGNGVAVEQGCTPPTPVAEHCEQLAFTEQTCTVCVDETGGVGLVQCARNDCAGATSAACRQDSDCGSVGVCVQGVCEARTADAPSSDAACDPPPACVMQASPDGGVCRTCPVEATGGSETLCVGPGAFVCTADSSASSSDGCVVCTDSDSGVEVYRDCSGQPAAPTCVDERNADGSVCTVCSDPVSGAPVYSSCPAQTCFALSTTTLRDDRGAPLQVAGDDAVAQCDACADARVADGAFLTSCALRGLCADAVASTDACAGITPLRVRPTTCAAPWQDDTTLALRDADELTLVLRWALVAQQVAIPHVRVVERGPDVVCDALCCARGDVLELDVPTSSVDVMRAALDGVLLP